MNVGLEDGERITEADANSPTPRALARTLLVFKGDEPEALRVPEGPAFTVGRGIGADLRIDDPTLSRKHACLRFGTHTTIEDLSSANGTYVGGVKLTAGRPVVVGPGVPLVFGRVHALLYASLAPMIVGHSDQSTAEGRALAEVIGRIAKTDLSVLLVGETGTGKSTLARRIHDESRRGSGPFEILPASALRAAVDDRTLAKLASGTLVIRDAGDLDADAEQRFIDALAAMAHPPRIIMIARSGVGKGADANRISPSLHRRLTGVSIVVPPLRKRVYEIAALAHSIAEETARASGRPAPIFAPDALAVLERHTWPGNVRELASSVASAVVLAGSRILTATHFVDLKNDQGSSTASIPRVDAGRGAMQEARERTEYLQIIEALRASHGNQTLAARALGISRNTLLARLDKYALPRPRKS